MPCSTNNDPNEMFYTAKKTFYLEMDIWKQYILEGSQFNYMDHLLMSSCLGEICQNIYVGYENYGPYLRVSPESDDCDVCHVDCLTQMRIKVSGVKSIKNSNEIMSNTSLVGDVLSINVDIDGDMERVESNTIPECEFQTIEELNTSSLMKIGNIGDLFNTDLWTLIFEYIDTRSLVSTCSKVCAHWFKMIFFDSTVMNQIFMNRVLDFFMYSSSQEKLMKLNERYQMNWLETYMMSGMFHFEMYGETIREELEHLIDETLVKNFFYTSIKLDPLQYLSELPRDHVLIERLSRNKPKVVMVSKNCTKSDLNQHFQQGFVTNLVSLQEDDDDLSAMEHIVFAPCTTPLSKGELSIDMKKGIPLYVNFLQSLSGKLDPHLPLDCSQHENASKIEWIGNCLCQMKHKATYFLLEVLPKHPHTTIRNLFIGDDIFIGLHLYHLDNVYQQTRRLCNLEPLNTIQLLENRQIYMKDPHSLQHINSFLPQIHQTDLLELLFQGNSNTFEFNFTSHAPFVQPIHATTFIREHIIELSQQTMCMINNTTPFIDEYVKFIGTRDARPRTPSKEVDLIFHLHMLHPNNFIQDCMRLAKSLKTHSLEYWKETNNLNWTNPLDDDDEDDDSIDDE